MHPRHDSRLESLEVQALYSIAALARIANVSTDLLRRVLRTNGVTFVHGGRALLVPLSELERKIPPLWESLRSASKLRRRAVRASRAS
jgi:hypothetical protein